MYLFENVPIHFLDVLQKGSGPLQGGGFVRLWATEWHQQVELITAQTNPPPAQRREHHTSVYHYTSVLLDSDRI